MAPKSPTKPSTRRLSEVARHLVIPAGIVSTGWPAVEAKCREFGDTFDVWQSGLGRVILGKRADGKYAATVGGITLSIPRQVAKTFIVARIIFALCVLFPGLKVLWTAHRTRTATNTFRSLSAFAKRKRVAPYIDTNDRGKAAIRTTNGEQEIRFRNGSIIMFGARADGFGRGFDEVDVEVFDEAQILDPKALEDMVAATNQSRHPHGALLFYMGTPPRPTDAGETFAERRAEALALKGHAPDFGEPTAAGDALYVECSADPDVGREGGPSLDDEKQVLIANPSYPLRTPPESIQRLRVNLKSDESWRREGLGVWDPGAGSKATISKDLWRQRIAETTPVAGQDVVGVKFSQDGTRVAAAVARKPEKGPVHVEVIGMWPMAEGVVQLTEWLVAAKRGLALVAIDGASGQGVLHKALRDAGVPQRRICLPTVAEVQTAHSLMLTAIQNGDMTHANQPGLNASVGSSTQRKIGTKGGWGWAPIADGDTVPLEAATYAHWGAARTKQRTSGSAGRGWRAVVP